MERKVSVLVVDDDVSQARTMSLILAKKGYAAAIANDGFEALAKAEHEAYDVILMDIKMPVMNGVETYKKIKEIQPRAVVIMMTAYVFEDLINEAIREGAYSVLHKPLDMDAVTALIDEALKKRNGRLILIVDDDESICATLQNIFIRKGYAACTVHSGEEAIEQSRKKRFKVILIDVKLPTINGLETYLAIKEFSPETVAVMITAYRQEMEEIVEEAINNGAYACINKPLDIDALLNIVDTIMKRKHGK